MDDRCRKYWLPFSLCSNAQQEHSATECVPALPLSDTHREPGAQGRIVFGAAAQSSERSSSGTPMPRFDVPGPMMKTVRDPALSLIALSGIDPSGPVMVEVPLVHNNSAFIAAQALAGWRVGFADRYRRGKDEEPIEHGAAFMGALDTLRQAGAHVVPVPALWTDETLLFDLHTHNEIDDLVAQYRLDALLSDSHSRAFHGACWSGYAVFDVPLEGGATLWFYGARSAKDSLAVMVEAYRRLAACPQR